MLSLLSLIIASGTVLRADTELWEPSTYPDPRTNATECNVPHDGTLCDPDHILTDTWRQTILDNVQQHLTKLQDAKIQYIEDASPECSSNSTEPVQIFIILAKRIHTASNQSITSADLTQFGHGIREAFGLDHMPCKNYILVLGVELAKQIYLWTGSDLAIPKEQLDNSLAQYKNLFTERNYMEGLNKIVDEISSLLLDPYKEYSTTSAPEETTENLTNTTFETTTIANPELPIPKWMYAILAICMLVTASTVCFFVFYYTKNFRNRKTFPVDLEQKPAVTVNNDDFVLENGERRRRSIDSENSHQPKSEHSDIPDNCSIASLDYRHEHNYENATSTKVTLNDCRLSTDNVVTRRNSELCASQIQVEDQFSSL
ncbi:unnamed protein product [Caenorhabditis angaria]|uniref:SEA domain-containing protein n=1 Tax=Caenorhabditis angaria TaxID=860376 RepID=A0A9P1IY60_9PELO|nr:unnamed protein product [Caenorhabditis angaria]